MWSKTPKILKNDTCNKNNLLILYKELFHILSAHSEISGYLEICPIFCFDYALNFAVQIVDQSLSRSCEFTNNMAKKYTALQDRYNDTGRFLDLRFDLYSPNHLCYRKYVFISIEASICGYLEPKKAKGWAFK